MTLFIHWRFVLSISPWHVTLCTEMRFGFILFIYLVWSEDHLQGWFFSSIIGVPGMESKSASRLSSKCFYLLSNLASPEMGM